MNNIKTYLYCLDDHRTIIEDLRKKFKDQLRYGVLSCQSGSDLVLAIEKEKDRNSCKIVIITLHEMSEQHNPVEKLISDIKKADKNTGIILVCHPEKISEVSKAIVFNVDSYIPQNANTVLRIHNTVKKLISEQNIHIRREKRNISLYVLMVFIVLFSCFAFFALRHFPEYF
ncbi:MAG TPA: hypothetical protein VHO50_01760 [Bacteroidales bacterium]|nr:hypothetical protein [Bacteroidales bacterium]